jgi:hypothetical protein
MKRVITATCLAAAFAVGLSAQQTGQSASTAQSDQKTVTFTGCVKAGEEPGSFILANAKADDKAANPAATSSATAGTSGTTGAAAASDIAAGGKVLRLTNAPPDVTLSEYVGKTVQVTGTAAPDASSTASTTTTTTSGATGTTTSSTSTSQKNEKPSGSINVRTVTMVSASCSM